MNLPSQWLIYTNVDDLNASMAQRLELGGKIIENTKNMGGYGRMAGT